MENKPFLCLAPIRGFTNALYRNLYAAHFQGIDAAIAPFISTLSVKQVSKSHIRDILPENNHGIPLVPQIIGNNPEGFIWLAGRFYDLGYDTVNWNLGCPFPMVAKKMRGSGLLPYPARIAAFLDAVIPRIPNRLSIKTRLGRKTADEIFNLIPVFNQYPLAELIIHPRTGIQMYTGEPDVDTFETCLPTVGHPVVYNGDIFSVETFRALQDRFQTVDRWMIGRGALTNPFLSGQIASGETAIERPIARFKRFHDELFEGYRATLSGQSHLVDKMKGYWQYFSAAFENGEKVFKKIKKLKTADKYETVVARFFHEEARWRPGA